MGNLSTLQTAPPFTSANASEMGKRSAEARKLKIKAQNDSSAKPAIEPQINRIVAAMKKEKVTSDNYALLVGHLDRLWNKAFPTQGAVKSRANLRQQPIAEPISLSEPAKPENG